MEVCNCRILNSGDKVSYKEIRLPPEGYAVEMKDMSLIEHDIIIDSLIKDRYNVVTSATLGFKPGKHRCYNATMEGKLIVASCSGIDI